MIKRLFQNDFFVSLLFLLAYLCTNSYVFAWDDQHLEIPLLKRLIDPTLYPGDYYVDALSKNFSSFLYPFLAKLITTDQIQPVYLVLFLVSRYFMFFWLYRLWQWLSGEKFAAAMAVLMFFLMGRTEEFLYRTFSHQEFSYIFMFAGFYYFYRERFLLAAMLLGMGANIHAIYCLFPMLYMLGHIFIFRRDRWVLLAKIIGVFAVFALPFLLWQIPHSLHKLPVPASQWLPLYLISCQQNFLFWTSSLAEGLKNLNFALIRLEPYLFLLVLYAFLMAFEPRLRRDKKTHAVILVAYALMVISFVFSYLIPSRFIVDLNLLRHEQFVRLLLMGYATIWACKVAKEGRPWQGAFAAIMLILIGFGATTHFDLRLHRYVYSFILIGFMMLGLIFKPNWTWLKLAMIVTPLTNSFINFSVYHYQYVQTRAHGMGMWQMYRSWLDMQKYVKTHTPKNALMMTPYDTEYGGFRIFSERRVLVCYRDCGLIGFDYAAAEEWHRRIKDIEGFTMYTNGVPAQALINAVAKYKVDYIVFMNYYQPGQPNPIMTKLYQNEVFALYEVKH